MARSVGHAVARALSGAALCATLVVGGESPPPIPSASGCEARDVTASEYWCLEMDLGAAAVEDDDGQRIVRVAGDSVCFRPGLTPACARVALGKLNDPTQRFHGYTTAVWEWLQRARTASGEWKQDAAAIAYRKRAEALLGREFPSPRDFDRWARENWDYLTWSDERKAFVVDEESKRLGRRPGQGEGEISAEEYWQLEGTGLIASSWEEDGYLHANVVSEHGHVVRLAKQDLLDRQSKERGWRKALAENVESLDRFPAGEQSYLETVRDLRRLTGMRFDSAEAWKKWWQANKDRLTLSRDGKRLVVADGPQTLGGGGR